MENYTWPEQLQKLAGITRTQYARLVQLDDSCAETADGIPIYAVMRVMSNTLNQAGVYSTTKHKNDMDSVKIGMQMQYENLTKLRISNQTKLGMLIRKEEAYKRILKFLYAFQNLMQHVIRLTSTKMPGNKRNNAIFLTENYNEAVKFLEENVNMLSWEEDGSLYMTNTRLDALTKIDEEMEKEIDGLNSLEEIEQDISDAEIS